MRSVQLGTGNSRSSKWPGGGGGRKTDPEVIREAEADRIRGKLKPAGAVLALTREGKPLASIELARYLESRGPAGKHEVFFLIGGAFGLSKGLLREADLRVSLSSMTLPHEMARLVLVEQLYRAGTILRNEPYHKGRA